MEDKEVKRNKTANIFNSDVRLNKFTGGKVIVSDEGKWLRESTITSSFLESLPSLIGSGEGGGSGLTIDCGDRIDGNEFADFGLRV